MLTPVPPKIDTGFRYIDKIEHVIAFFVLSFLLVIATSRGRVDKKRTILISAVSLVVYGVLVERVQVFTGRNMEFMDIIADLTGIVFGSLVAKIFCD